MKKSLLSLIVLLAFVLCSCTSNSPNKTSPTEPTGAEPMSIVFMGDKITAPGSYPDVPDLYAPVLDDLYLYGELGFRYETLNYEGKATTEIMHQCEALQVEIRQRGHLPYPGDGSGTDGYALFDLDGDNSPELLLLDIPFYDSSRKQIPTICSIFAIRNGQLTCIKNGSFEFSNDTVLATDGTFYQCTDWRGAGYTYLSIFRLEPGASEFTIISEARATLLFSDGNVPVPYWVKKENGKEINITEDEFETIFKQYNSQESLNLNFVLLRPDEVNPWSIPRPAEKSLLTEPIECPQSYAGALSAYKPILDDLYLFSERMRLGESFEYTWENAGELGFVEPLWDGIGYALVDINNDGIPELLLGSIDGLNNASPHSIFTLKDGKPVLLESFWSRSRGKLSADGIIYSVGSGGAAYTYLSSYRLDRNADKLTKLTEMFSDYSSSEEKSYFVQVVNGKNHYITEKEFWNFREEYENPAKIIKLTVFPIVHP